MSKAIITLELLDGEKGQCSLEINGNGGDLVNLIASCMKANPKVATLFKLAVKTFDASESYGDKDFSEDVMAMMLAAMGQPKPGMN